MKLERIGEWVRWKSDNSGELWVHSKLPRKLYVEFLFHDQHRVSLCEPNFYASEEFKSSVEALEFARAIMGEDEKPS